MYLELEVCHWINLMEPVLFLASGDGRTVPDWSLWLVVVFPDILGRQGHIFSTFFASNFQFYFAVIHKLILAIQNEK